LGCLLRHFIDRQFLIGRLKKFRVYLRPDQNGGAAQIKPEAENHHRGGTRPPEPHESPLVQVALLPLNFLRTMQLKESPLVARHWHPACILSGGLVCSEEGGDTNEIQGDAIRYAATKEAVNDEPERFVL